MARAVRSSVTATGAMKVPPPGPRTRLFCCAPARGDACFLAARGDRDRDRDRVDLGEDFFDRGELECDEREAAVAADDRRRARCRRCLRLRGDRACPEALLLGDRVRAVVTARWLASVWGANGAIGAASAAVGVGASGAGCGKGARGDEPPVTRLYARFLGDPAPRRGVGPLGGTWTRWTNIVAVYGSQGASGVGDCSSHVWWTASVTTASDRLTPASSHAFITQ